MTNPDAGPNNDQGTDYDGDVWSDGGETACGSDPLPSASIPSDSDGDGACDALDQCTGDDATGDTDGDVTCSDSDSDDDGDGWSDIDETSCGSDPLVAGSVPADGDGDGVCDALDPCTGDDATGDTDSDTICNDLDTDDDGDGWSDVDEIACGTDLLLARDAPVDSDGDGVCNDVDTDDDNDTVPDSLDNDPLDANVCTDADGDTCDDCSSGSFDPSSDGNDADLDGICNDGDIDDDNDAILDDGDSSGVLGDSPCRDGRRADCDDNCPGSPNPDQDDVDNDGVGDICDAVIARDSTLLVAVGRNGTVVYSTDDGSNWNFGNHSAGTVLLEAVGYGHGVWIVLGQYETYLRSTDGINWTVYTNDLIPGAIVDLEGIDFDGIGRWMVGAGRGWYLYSDDGGLSWNAPGKLNGGSGNVEDFHYHDGRWVGVGDDGGVFFSDDPTDIGSWVQQKITQANLEAVFYSGGLWLVAGDNGEVWASNDDANNWTQVGGAGTNDLEDIHYCDRWLTGGGYGDVSTSATGLGDWTTTNVSPPLDATGIWGVWFESAARRWLAVDETGKIGLSDDGGATWVRANDAATGGGQLFGIVGN